MSWLTSLKARLPQDRFIRNIGWMGVGEVGIRLSRLVATVLLARLLSPEAYGLAAIVLMTTEFVRVFTRNGIGDKLVQADAGEVAELCQTAWCLNWLIGLGLFLVQFAGSFLVGRFYADTTLVLPIILVGGTYLIYPLAMVQTALVRRENRLKIFSLTNLAQVVADNVLTAVLALMGFGMWAIVLPKLLVAPVWVWMMLHYEPWRPRLEFTLDRWQRILGFGSRILGVELLNTFRENVDYLLIGRLIGLKALGVYYFAFNAGLGLSLSVINALGVSLYSDLCDIRSDPTRLKLRFDENILTITRVIVPLVALQASLAPLYVPIVFGQKWVEAGAVPILILICLSALSRPFANAASMLFRSVGLPQVDLNWNLAFTVVLTLAVVFSARWGSLGVAVAVAVVHLGLQPIYLLMGRRLLHRQQARAAAG
ncbi:lipopolysaccharide biosynthesis protein [Cyanobium sp. Morenito 9A2]|uniref:lipopolysaccharide biosynthesis protein n=1 Tax=Cyanobium sp. Morenito 9A2 TaxID=2823718 RepID=UPI0020CE4631|nr:lipopolysaccharide biosynthesis protein [Cyanobium sp. Morenito 9A2]MCP9849448.1 lipopolysaccharide biosynthesis protein [Cyanobium sp. Morenito 9A2]